MRKPVVVISLFLLLFQIGVVTGCRGTREPDDARLVVADSLLASDPDSALALVEALTRDSLTTDGDRAYRDLIVTQARYKCYITATSDSDINRALGYYRAHSGDQEKLTRAYIYKGAVMEELGYPDSAMFYYKHAEATAASDDYFNLGYVNMRIATLYKDELSQDTTAILRYRNAIRYFTILNDTNYLISCYGDLGAFYGVNRPDSTEYCLSQAIDLAKKYSPSKQYTYKSKLAGLNLYYKKDFRKANLLSMDVLRNGSDESYESQFYYYAALSFIKLGLLDSAKYVLGITPAPVDMVDSMNYHKVIAEIAKAENNPELYQDNIIKSVNAKAEILENRADVELMTTEYEFNKTELEKRGDALRDNNNILLLFLLGLVFLVVLSLLIIYRLYSNVRRYKKEIKLARQELDLAIEEQQKLDVSKLVGYRISALNELQQSIRLKTDEGKRVKRIIPLSSFFKDLHEKNAILKLRLNESFWQKMKLSVDGEYNGIMSFIERKYSDLSEDDLKLFCLLCANLSPQIIKVCMNYANAKTVSNYRRKIIRNKMKLDMSFDEFREKYINGELN